MALFDFLKRKKEAEKASASAKSYGGTKKKPAEKKAGKVSDVKPVKEAKVEKPVKPVISKTVKTFSYNVVKEPHISEKSTNLSEMSKYVFKVYHNANKPEIKKAVEGIYGVDVLSVNIIKIPSKKIRLGRTEGFKKGYLKAIVTIKEGQKIEIF